MKNAWIAYVLMTTASRSAMTTRIGNSRQNDRLLRVRRPTDLRPPVPEPADSEPADLTSEVLGSVPSSGDASAWAAGSLSGVTGWPWSWTGGVALSPEPASGSAPGVPPRPAPLIRAPSDRVHR